MDSLSEIYQIINFSNKDETVFPDGSIVSAMRRQLSMI